METKKLLAIVAVVVVVLAGSSVALVTLNNNSDDNDKVVSTGRLWVYGNANNDDYLDEKDIDAIKDIIKSDNGWDRTTYPYADTNCDGKVDSADIDYLQDLLDKKDTRIYFTQYWAGEKSVSSIKYPFTGTIACGYYQAADVTTLLGIWDKVVAAESVVTMSYTYKYPNVANLIPLGALTSMNAETVDACGASVYIAYINTDGKDKQVQSDLKAMGSKCEVVALPIQGMDCLSSVVTLGVLLGAEEASHKYVKYFETIYNYLKSSLSSVEEKDYLSYVACYQPTDKDSIRIESSVGNRVRGDLSYFYNIPATYMFPVSDNDSWFIRKSQEDFVSMDPQCIVIAMSGTTSGITAEAAQEKFENLAAMFKDCSCYNEKKVIGVSFGMTSTFSGMASLVLLASKMYPGTVSEEYGWQLLQQWYDDFTSETVDVHKVGGAVYTLP